MTTFLKQYGAQRTGTNYLRILLQKNYSDVCTLMHILGDKHSPPAPFEDLWAEAKKESNPALAFVSQATFRHPSLSTSAKDPRQHETVRQIAGPLTQAYLSRTLGFVVSIKNPYAWVPSIAAYERVIGRRAPLPHRLAEFARGQCLRFNDLYGSWLGAARDGFRTLVVRHEDLVSNPERVLEDIDDRFGLQRTGPFVDEAGTAPPVFWDFSQPSLTTAAAFDRSYYTGERYLDRLSPEIVRTITETIDWSRLRALGYLPL